MFEISPLPRLPSSLLSTCSPLAAGGGQIDLSGIDWVIVGGETGWGARRMDTAWVIRLRHQCQAGGVPFFFKQWGGEQKSKHGRQLDGRTCDDMPPRSTRRAPSRSHRLALIDELATGVTA